MRARELKFVSGSHAASPLRLAGALSLVWLAACSDLPEEPGNDQPDVNAALVTGSAFSDDFSFFDESRWVRGSHMLGRGLLLPGNVVQSGSMVGLLTNSDGYTGAEIMSREQYGTGTFTIRARCSVPLGAICAFFLYQISVGDRADEIDMEIIPATGQIAFTTWRRGHRSYRSSFALAFDPAAAFHTYSFERTADQLRFMVDGAVVQSFTNSRKLPQAVMPVFANAWWPTWLSPIGDAGAWEIDSISVE